MLYLGLWLECWKTSHISNKRPPNCRITKFCTKIRVSKFGTKKFLFKCFVKQLWKAFIIFEINTLEFSLLQSFVQKAKILKCGSKNARFWYFGAGISEHYCHIWNQRPRICHLAKLCPKKTHLNLGRKMPDLGIVGLEVEKYIVIFEISILEFAYLENFVKKWKCLNLGQRMPYLSTFGLEFENYIVILEINRLEFV